MPKEDFTVFVGNLAEKVTEEILYELFLQAGPLKEVRIPINNGVRKSFGFVEFKHEVSVPYALRLLDSTKLFGRPIKLNSRSQCLHLYQPPPQFRSARMRVGKPLSSDDAPLRMMGGGQRRKFMDKAMLPGGPSRKSQKGNEDVRADNDSGKSWAPNDYPSQREDFKSLNQREDFRSLNHRDDFKSHNNHNGHSRNKNRFEQGLDHSKKSYQKKPYFNERHHNRDKNRHDSNSSQRPRSHHRPPFTR